MAERAPGRRGEGGSPGATPGRDRARLVGRVLAGAILVAPFLALLYGPDAGLAVMALALGATAFLTRDAARGAEADLRRWLLVATAVNGTLAAACVVVLIARLA